MQRACVACTPRQEQVSHVHGRRSHTFSILLEILLRQASLLATFRRKIRQRTPLFT